MAYPLVGQVPSRKKKKLETCITEVSNSLKRKNTIHENQNDRYYHIILTPFSCKMTFLSEYRQVIKLVAKSKLS